MSKIKSTQAQTQNEKVTDYHTMVSIDTPVADRRKLNIGDIWVNAAKCLECSEEIRSRNRHDLVTCSCGNLSVDGGSWYAKRLYKYTESYEDLSEPFLDIPESVIEGEELI